MDFVEIVRISVIYFTIFRKSLLKFPKSQEPGREAGERDVVLVVVTKLCSDSCKFLYYSGGVTTLQALLPTTMTQNKNMQDSG